MAGGHRFIDDLVQDVVGDEAELKQPLDIRRNDAGSGRCKFAGYYVYFFMFKPFGDVYGPMVYTAFLC